MQKTIPNTVEWLQHYQQHYLPDRNIIEVQARISKVLTPNPASTTHASHEIFFVDILKIIENPDVVDESNSVEVAKRYSDREGLRPILELKEGEPITIRGVYIPKEQSYLGPDGEHHPVLHWTHHPIGWIEYQGQCYE